MNWEPLSKEHKILVSKEHTFNTDTILLANFSAPKKKAICADFGTGCGTIAVLWAIRQNPAKIYAVEIQEKAYNQTLETIKYNNFTNIKLINADIKKYKDFLSHACLDQIACNPPYKANGAGIKNDVDNMRIARHEDELSLEDLAKASAFCLKFGGKFFMCQRPERLADAMCILRKYSLEPKRLRLVEQKQGKAASLFLLECRRGGKPGLEILPTLIIEKDGNFTDEMIRIYGEYREGQSG